MPNEVKLLPSNSAKFCCVRRMGDYVIIAVTPKGEEPSRYWLSRGGAETLCAEISGALSRHTTVVTDEVVERAARAIFDDHNRVYSVNQCKWESDPDHWRRYARAALTSMPTVVTGER